MDGANGGNLGWTIEDNPKHIPRQSDQDSLQNSKRDSLLLKIKANFTFYVLYFTSAIFLGTS